MYCPKCGEEDVGHEKYCMFCGAELVDNQNFNGETTAQLVCRNVKCFGKKSVRLLGGIKNFAAKHKLISVPVLILLILWIIIRIINGTVFSPKRVAENYFRAVVESDAQKAYNCIDIINSDFTNKSAFFTYWDQQFAGKEIYNYQVTARENEYDAQTEDVSRMEQYFTIQYYARGHQNAEQMTVTVVKSSRKKLFVFDEYKVMPDFLVTNYTIMAPKQSTVMLDGTVLENPITDDTHDVYQIAALFAKEYEISVEAPMGEPINQTLFPSNDSTFELYEYHYNDETVGELFRQSVNQAQKLLDSGISGNGFPNTIALSPDSTAEEAYLNLQQMLVNADTGTGYVQFDLYDAENSSYDQYFTADEQTYQCDFYFSYDYTRMEESWGEEELQKIEGSDSGGGTMRYEYYEGEWILREFNLWY